MPDARSRNASPPATPTWVKVFAIVAGVVVVLLVVLLLTGRHGPGRHAIGRGAVTPAAADQAAARFKRPEIVAARV